MRSCLGVHWRESLTSSLLLPACLSDWTWMASETRGKQPRTTTVLYNTDSRIYSKQYTTSLYCLHLTFFFLQAFCLRLSGTAITDSVEMITAWKETIQLNMSFFLKCTQKKSHVEICWIMFYVNISSLCFLSGWQPNKMLCLNTQLCKLQYPRENDRIYSFYKISLTVENITATQLRKTITAILSVLSQKILTFSFSYQRKRISLQAYIRIFKNKTKQNSVDYL